MKKIIKTTVAIVVLVSLLVVAPMNKATAQFNARISIQGFYNELSPYGQWIDDPDLGYVWIPDAGPDFRPYYSRGHWVMTGYGAMWMSNYSWGWAPFHYGRWAFSSYYSAWVWIPDTVWGPAWVSWRWGSGYCGWAPLGPGMNVGITFGSNYLIPNDWWVFIPAEHCLNASFYNYRIAPQRNITYVRNTTIINNTYINNNVTYAAGPDRNAIERITHNKVPVYNISDAGRPGRTSVQGSALNVYRPQVTKTNQGSKPVPPVILTRDQYRKNKGLNTNGMQNNNNNNNKTGPVNKSDQPAWIERKPPEQQNIPVPKKQTDQPVIERKPPERQNMTLPKKQTDQPVIERKQVQQQNIPVPKNQTDQPVRTFERKPPEQQNIPVPKKQTDQPVIERKQVQQQNIPDRTKQDHPVVPIERKPPQQQNMPVQNKQVNQVPQQKQVQSKPANNGNGKKGNN